MNKLEFINEVNNSNIQIDNFEAIYSRFCYFQLEAIKTLKEVVRICEKESINYQLAYGSLLGAIRDHGQIPWDYDIDIFIPFSERTRFIESLKNNLSDDFYFFTTEVSSNCRHFVIRVAPIEFKTEVLHVDVFFLIGAPENSHERKRFAKEVKQAFRTRYFKKVNIFEEGLDHPKAFLTILFGKIKSMFKSLKKTDTEYFSLCNRFDINNSKYCITADSFADWYEIPTEYVLETIYIQTDNGLFQIPREYDKFLRLLYGNYIVVPPLDRRIKEMLFNYNKIENSLKKDKI